MCNVVYKIASKAIANSLKRFYHPLLMIHKMLLCMVDSSQIMLLWLLKIYITLVRKKWGKGWRWLSNSTGVKHMIGWSRGVWIK